MGDVALRVGSLAQQLKYKDRMNRRILPIQSSGQGDMENPRGNNRQLLQPED